MENNNLLMSQHWLEQYLCIPGDKDEQVYAMRCTERHRKTFGI
jgi:hypothetical protein